MFLPIEKDALIPLSQIDYAYVEKGAVYIIDCDGDKRETPYSLDMIEAMAVPIVPAADGFVKLFYSFDDKDSFQEHPVLAWRIRSPFAPEPVSLFDDQFFPPGLTAVRYPDGRVVTMDGDEAQTLTDTKAWQNYARQERLVWLKTQ